MQASNPTNSKALKRNLRRKLRRTKKVKLGKQTNPSMDNEITPSTNDDINHNDCEGDDSDKQKEIFYNPQKPDTFTLKLSALSNSQLDILSNASRSELYENNDT
ncbi:9183_t:CDS:2 [Dentiscutata heterogama]|uniref:9183_t:CDS:1 n=1 Tax=Dentiscutata heterogama TaxID=1316150 RepID=A0ACA9KJW1_9GLOM|nr:9183_t:CDS:2 [Dentiscutata heterogama]